ncbi:HamA C-terminal domain-containing protein [Olivibacter domesticus]|uniref:Anti-bacteriophage protein A/HamA C-terminal domain-containing protein n=1 Tax=Olivibacter domesticus TaxID=407022 RepID=A0A1H7JRF9_OLID1|nr:DUF1837 domain-containing protein [Olivibacter domesticus]SEK76560.1 protein of unknown function [Olivibacter domesticus]
MLSTDLVFEILIDDQFAAVNLDTNLQPIDKKRVLSIINDFEDGKWRYSKFMNFIFDNVAETALTHKERESLIGSPSSVLNRAAKNLRLTDKKDKISQGSEMAEIILYGIMKNHYKALPVVPKIYYKQNTQDNAKGADSVHIVVDEAGEFSIWFGEAKFYNSIEDTRLSEIVQSVGNSLIKEKLKKENGIITGVSDLNTLITDENLRNSIKNILSPNTSIDILKPRLHIPILLLHQCEFTSKQSIMNDAYKQDLINYHAARAEAYFKKQIETLKIKVHLYEQIAFHIILFPVPTKAYITEKFVSTVEFHKDND